MSHVYMIQEQGTQNYKIGIARQLKSRVEKAIFDLAYPTGHAAYTGDHKMGQMLNGRRYLLSAILMHLEERL